MDAKADIMIMSGVEDGTVLKLDGTSGEGAIQSRRWTITIGRRDDNDICLRNDTFVSRQHSKLHLIDNKWQLEDCDSTNGTFIEVEDLPLEDRRVYGTVPLRVGQLFRIGRTWMRIQQPD
jgi:pSer/pThr/pTyr-binding forkhead associated (FHA) protein